MSVNFDDLCLVFYAKLVDGFLRVNLSGLKHHGREVGTIRTIGEVLCLEAKCRVLAEGSAMLTLVAISPVV